MDAPASEEERDLPASGVALAGTRRRRDLSLAAFSSRSAEETASEAGRPAPSFLFCKRPPRSACVVICVVGTPKGSRAAFEPELSGPRPASRQPASHAPGEAWRAERPSGEERDRSLAGISVAHSSSSLRLANGLEPSPVQLRSRPDAATARMAPNSFGLMVLFLWIQRAANEPVVTGIIGSTVELRCHYTGEPLIPNTFRIQWQKEGVTQCLVDAYFPNQDMEEHQCKEFTNRTQIDKQLKDVSLKLWHVGLNDERTYECVIQGRKNGMFEVIHLANITLKVAANNSKPDLTVLEQSEEEMTFSCNSSHGYPQQKLYWINQTDNSLLNATETSIKEPDGTFSVYSVLTIKKAPDIKLGCQIENERLQQNITTIFESSNSTSSRQIDAHQHKTTIVLSVVAPAVAIALILILYFLWDKNKPSHQGTYTGVFENEEAVQHNAPD